MRVCMLAYTFYEADNRVRRYAEALAKRGDEVDAIALQREGQARFEVIRGVRVYRIQKRRIDERRPFNYLWKLLLFFARSAWFLMVRSWARPYDLIHVHSVTDFEVFATIVPKILGARVILDIHDIVPELYASKFRVTERSLIFRLLLVIERLSAAYSDRVIISNDLWKDKLTALSVAAHKCTALINYPDQSIFYRRPHNLDANGEFRICYPGTLNQHQGVDVAVKAVAILREKLPNLKLLVIGDGPDRSKLKAMVEDEHLGNCVTLQDFVPIETIAEILSTVDLGIVPKRKDSFGNEAFSTKIMEFMAMGVPVVAARTVIDEYYFNDALLQFFESGNADDLADKILELARDPAKRDALRSAATSFIAYNNWDVKKKQYLDLVDSLTNKRSLSSARQDATTPVA